MSFIYIRRCINVLNKTVRNTFAALNMPILDGYGMPECVGTSRLHNSLSDSVGSPLEAAEFRIEHVRNRDPRAKHGEICFRGRNCLMYLNEPERTNKILHSGDTVYFK